MVNPISITSANSVFMVSVLSLGVTNQRLQGYSADNAFSTADIEVTENQIGVDGLKSAGYLPQLFVQTLDFQANSPSIALFEQIYESMAATKGVFTISGIIQLPDLGKQYNLALGTLQSYQPILNARRVMEAASYTINWGGVVVSPII